MLIAAKFEVRDWILGGWVGLGPGWEGLSVPGSGQEGIPAASGGDLHAHSSQV